MYVCSNNKVLCMYVVTRLVLCMSVIVCMYVVIYHPYTKYGTLLQYIHNTVCIYSTYMY